MPWVISAACHVAAALVLMLVVFMVIRPADSDPVTRAMAFRPELTNNQTIQRQKQDPTPTGGVKFPDPARDLTRDWSRRHGPQSAEPNLPIRIGPPPGGEVGLGETPGSGPYIGVPKLIDLPAPGASHVVFVIDRSGSMHKTFGIVRREMESSILQLSWDDPDASHLTGRDEPPGHTFHVIFFADGDPLEAAARQLVPANMDNKISACAYINSVEPAGQTDPIPALKRAFTVLAHAKKNARGKVIYLLTDADFPDNMAVLETITRLNERQGVMINTILFGRHSEQAEYVMKQIAKDSSGRYKFVSLDEIQGGVQ